MTRIRPAFVVAMGLLLVTAGGVSVALAAPTASGSDRSAGPLQSEAGDQPRTVTAVGDGRLGADLADLASARIGSAGGSTPQVANETQESVRAGVQAGARLARDRGTTVSESRVQAAIQSAVRAAGEHQNASPDAVRAAAQGASHGAFVQNQSLNATQLQASVYGGTAGALSQSQGANATQLQSAAYGAAHGASAQHQRVSITQMQFAAVGAAAGATQQGAQSQQSSVAQIQEAAQGASYGALDQRQTLNVTQIQAAAFGAAGGAAERTGAGTTDPKKVQEAAMGAAKGTLVQEQRASVSQIQAAASGAARGALVQAQVVSVTQVQEASFGAASGSISQYQSASVSQIQAAAAGGARGSLTQIQTVEVIQIQHAAFGAAKGAARTAAQYQITNVQQIQAAAAGAGQGAVVQIQRVDVQQIQALAAGAADGALSQFQQASVVQIQSAARGASEGALTMTQIQIVTVTQIQIISHRAAADTARAAARTGIDHDTKIYKKAKGDAGDTDPDGEPDLGSLFYEVQNETLFLANPNDVSVTVSVTSETGTADTITLAPGESLTRDFDPALYTLTAESEDGRTVEFAGRDRLRIFIGEDRQSLTASVDNGTLTVANVNDVDAWVTVSQDGARVVTFNVGPTGDRSWSLDPGTYTVTAEIDGERVPVNDQDAAPIEVQADRIPLSVSVANESIAVTNPSRLAATVAVTDDATGDAVVEVDAGPGATERQSLDPGDYTLTGRSGTGAEVTLNGQSELGVTVAGAPNRTANLSVAIENATDPVQAGNTLEVTAAVTNDGEAATQATAALELENGTEVDTASVDVGAGQTARVALSYETSDVDVGTQNLTVRVDGVSATTAVAVTEVPNRTASLQVDDQTGDGASLEVANATAGESFYVEARYGDNASQSRTVDAGGTLTNVSLPLDPQIANNTSVTVAIRAAEDDTELATAAINYTVEGPPDEEPSRQLTSCTVISEPGTYELVDNVTGGDGDVCIEIQSGDVRLDGQGYEIRGPGDVTGTYDERAPIGIYVNNTDVPLTPDITDLENVTIVNVSVSGWNRGITGSETGNINLTVADSAIRDNWAGADFNAGSSQYVSFQNVTIAGNEEYGATHGGVGGGVLAISDSLVENNSEGIFVADSTPVSIDSSTFEGNGAGLHLGTLSGPSTISNTTIRDNDVGISTAQGNYRFVDTRLYDNRVALNSVGEYEAVNVELGQVITVDSDGYVEASLHTVAGDAAPDLPNGTSVVGDGLNVTTYGQTIDGTVQATFTSDETAATGDVELWRYDGTTWTPVATETPAANGTLQATIDQTGLYVPVTTTSVSGVNATVGNQAVWVENPTSAPVTASVGNESGTVASTTVDPGANQSIQAITDGEVVLQPGDYTLTAEGDGGQSVPIDGNSSLNFSLPPGLDSLSLTAENGTVTVSNPTDVTVDVTVFVEAETVAEASIPPGESQQLATEDLEPGTYMVFATTDDGRSVPVNGRWTASVELAAAEPDSLGIAVDDATVTFDNPNDAAVRVTIADGLERALAVPGESTETVTLEPGNYTARAVTVADGTPVQIDGQDSYSIAIETIGPSVAETATPTPTASPSPTTTPSTTETTTSTPSPTPTPTPSPTEAPTTEPPVTNETNEEG